MRALLIIDVQKDYFQGGNMQLANTEAALAGTEAVLRYFRTQNLPVIHVQHINTRQGATFFLPNTVGAELHEHLTPKENESLVVKHYPNSFYQTNLLDLIKADGITELVVCGMMTHMCIDTTVRAAKDHGLPVTLIGDACATRDLTFGGVSVPAQQVQAAFLAALSGMFAQITTGEEYCRNQ